MTATDPMADASPDTAAPSGKGRWLMSDLTKDNQREELIEEAYWDFDARRNGLGQWKGRSMSERDAFKTAFRGLMFKAGILHE